MRFTQLAGSTLALYVFTCLSGCVTGHFEHSESSASLGLPVQTDLPNELNKVILPPYRIEAPDVLLIEVYGLPEEKGKPAVVLAPQPISGNHLVRSDGMVNLGIWGNVKVSGLTIDEAKVAVQQHVFEKMSKDPVLNEYSANVDKPEKLFTIVDVVAYNSKSYYVISDGAGYGEQITRFPIQGNETVLDALANVNGLQQVSSKDEIWIARRSPNQFEPDNVIPVDYVAMTQRGWAGTNYQLLPGDRVYVQSQQLLRVDSYLQKVLTPIERVLGITLLGGSTYNSIARPNVLNRGF
ncbi:MAG: polysaccharide biosynthesis/export family protein [Zavarzinella sp.]